MRWAFLPHICKVKKPIFRFWDNLIFGDVCLGINIDPAMFQAPVQQPVGV
jgi:hypothetical protein